MFVLYGPFMIICVLHSFSHPSFLPLGVHNDVPDMHHLALSSPWTPRSLESHWSSIKDQLGAEAMHVSRVASTLEQQALQPLQVYMLADLDKRFRVLVQEGRRVIKEYVNAKGVLAKTRDKYYRYVACCTSCGGAHAYVLCLRM